MLSLINKSNKSYGRSLLSPVDIAEHAAKNGIPVAALTDVHTLSALPDFLLACQERGVHGIAGLTVQITENDRPLGEMVVLAKGGKGFVSLRKLVDITGHLGDNAIFTPSQGLPLSDLLEGKHKKLLSQCIMLDGFPGSIGEALAKKDAEQYDVASIKAQFESPESRLAKLREQFVEGDYLGVQTPIAKSPIAGVLAMPPSLVNEVEPESRRGVLETTMAIAKNNAQLAQVKQWFKQYADEYLSSLGNDSKINQMINRKFLGQTLQSGQAYEPSQPPFLGADHLIEKCRIPNIFSKTFKSGLLKGGPDVMQLKDMVTKAWSLYAHRVPENSRDDYWKDITEELEVIQACGFENYFLNVIKVKKLAQDQGNDYMLRGSASASMIMHVLGMSPVNPKETGLMFSRFLNKERIEDPDVDIEFSNPSKITRDLESAFEHGQIAYLSSDDGVSQLVPLLTAAKDHVLNFSKASEQQKANVIANYLALVKPVYIEHHQKSIQKITERNKKLLRKNKDAKTQPLPEPINHQELDAKLSMLSLKEAKFGPSLSDWVEKSWSKVPEQRKTSEQLMMIDVAMSYGKLGLSSSLSPGSVVLIPEGVGRYFNLLRAKKDTHIEGAIPRIPQTKYNILSTGHIKYDFLANKSFTRAMNAYTTLGLPKDKPLDLKDPAIRKVFQSGGFLGVNQMSGFMGASIAEVAKPEDFFDITAINALIRDGGVEKGQEDAYTIAKRNQSHNALPLPFQEHLSETYGLLLYEEQFLNLLTKVGGFSYPDADQFRSALKKAKADDDPVGDNEARFIEHVMGEYNITQEEAAAWYTPIREKRGRYLFNKAHAVSYAHVAVRQCILKVCHPAQYAAEIFLDSNVTFKNEKVNLSMVLNDWAKVFPKGEGSPDSAMDFMNCIMKVLVREERNVDSSYSRNLQTVKSKLIFGIEQGVFDVILSSPEQQRDVLSARCEFLFSKLEERGYEPLSPNKDGSISKPKRKIIEKKDGSRVIEEDVYGTPDEERLKAPVNRRLDEKGNIERIDWNKDCKITIPDLLSFFAAEGIVKGLEQTERSGGSLVASRFNIKNKAGQSVPYHVVGRVVPGTKDVEKIDSGFHQGGSRNRTRTDTFTLLVELSNAVGIKGVPEAPVKKAKNDGSRELFDWSDGKKSGRFLGSIGRFAQASKHDLHDAQSMGRRQYRLPANTTSPVMLDLSPAQQQTAQKKAVELLADTRFIGGDTFAMQLNNGHISYAQVMSDKPMRGERRGEFVEVLANYRKVDSETPIYELPNIVNNEHASGGHQRFLFDKEKNQASKMDQGFTTKAITGHIHGHVSKGMTTLWAAEAAIDAWSFNELQLEIQKYNVRTGSSLAFAEQNCVSIRSAGGAVSMIEDMLDVTILDKSVDVNTRTGEIDFKQIKVSTKLTPFTDKDQVSIKQWFEENKIHWLAEDTPENKEAEGMMMAVMHAAGMTEQEIQNTLVVHAFDPNKTLNQNVSQAYQSMKGENQQFLHRSNMKTWLRGSGFMAEKQSDGSYHAGGVKKVINEGRWFSTMSPAEQYTVKKHLRAKFEHLSGAKSFGLALDADGAGLQDALRVKFFCETIGVPVAEMMPEPKEEKILLPLARLNGAEHPFGQKDHNDYLSLIRYHQQTGSPEKADEILLDYAKTLKPAELKLSTPKQDDDEYVVRGRGRA